MSKSTHQVLVSDSPARRRFGLSIIFIIVFIVLGFLINGMTRQFRMNSYDLQAESVRSLNSSSFGGTVAYFNAGDGLDDREYRHFAQEIGVIVAGGITMDKVSEEFKFSQSYKDLIDTADNIAPQSKVCALIDEDLMISLANSASTESAVRALSTTLSEREVNCVYLRDGLGSSDLVMVANTFASTNLDTHLLSRNQNTGDEVELSTKITKHYDMSSVSTKEEFLSKLDLLTLSMNKSSARPPSSLVMPSGSFDNVIFRGRVVWSSKLDKDALIDIYKYKSQPKSYWREYIHPVTLIHTISYVDNKGSYHEVSVLDDITLNNILSFRKIKNIPLDINANGYATSEMWDYITHANKTAEGYTASTNFEVSFTNIVVGQGAFFEIENEGAIGKRSISGDGKTITSVSTITPPAKAVVRRYGHQVGHVAITFDDGPDPVYTEQVLKTLKEQNIKATFFVTGVNVLNYPEIARRIVEEGHLIGNHTYNHAALSSQNQAEIEMQIASTNQIIERVTGIAPKYYRTPYTIFGNYGSRSDLPNLRIAQAHGLLVQEVDINSEDWVAKNGGEIVEHVKRGIEGGNIATQILFHDSGGKSRVATLESLPLVIDMVKAKGFNIERTDITLSRDPYQSRLEVAPLTILSDALSKFSKYALYFSYFAITIGILRILIGSFFVSRNTRNIKDKYKNQFAPPVTVIVPAYNEEKVVVDTILSILASDYPALEVILSDDGSTDKTRSVVQDKFKNDKRVSVITKVNGGKSSALNHGISKAEHDFVVCVDADSQFEVSTIRELIAPLADIRIGAVAGVVHVGNVRNILTNNQRFEYILSQFFYKIIQSELHAIAVIPGCVGAFRKSVIVQVGLYQDDTLAEDTDMTLRIQKAGHRVVLAKNAVSITEAPESFEQFFKQRMRWQFGTLQILWKHKSMIGDLRYGFMGCYVMIEMFVGFIFAPIFVFSIIKVLLNIPLLAFMTVSPNSSLEQVINYDESLSYFTSSIAFFGLFIAATLVMSLFSLYTQRGEGDKGKYLKVMFNPLSVFAYQVYTSYISTLALIGALIGTRIGWGHLTRTGSVALVSKLIKF